jgi:hypothetical protein
MNRAAHEWAQLGSIKTLTTNKKKVKWTTMM